MFALITFILLCMNPTLTVTSPDFKAGDLIPSVFACDGSGINPALHIAGEPSGTESLALIVHDPDAEKKGGFDHWVAWNIAPSLTDIPRDFKGAVQGTNSGKKLGYMGPCPPSGTHHYHFHVYALDRKLTIDPQSDADALQMAMKGHILAEGELVGLYKAVRR
jgi:Raf kinase inhibitor-like YbhB/YbcL family protein